MSIVERILGVFLSYAELAQGWNPQEEGDYQDFVDAVGNALAPAEQCGRVDEGMVDRMIEEYRRLEPEDSKLMEISTTDGETRDFCRSLLQAALAQNAQGETQAEVDRQAVKALGDGYSSVAAMNEPDAKQNTQGEETIWCMQCGKHTAYSECDNCPGNPGSTHAERARVPDGCKHDGKIIVGSKGKSADRVGAEIAWCSKCGQITWGGDADPNANAPRFEDWCNQHLAAFGCAKETRGEKACASWCGHYETCAAAPAQTEDAA